MPAALARRIAVYTDDETRRLQLDRYCNRVQEQRRSQERRCSKGTQGVDFIELNKGAIVSPASLSPDHGNSLEGKQTPGFVPCNKLVCRAPAVKPEAENLMLMPLALPHTASSAAHTGYNFWCRERCALRVNLFACWRCLLLVS